MAKLGSVEQARIEAVIKALEATIELLKEINSPEDKETDGTPLVN